MTTEPDRTRPPIAVVGVSALFPGSVDSTGFWHDILAGTDRITDVPPTHWLIDDYFDEDMAAPDKTYGRRGGFLTAIDLDVLGFGVPPSQLPSTDTAQLLALIVAQRVLDDAVRGQFCDLDRSRVSVILGVTSGQELLGAMASRMNRPMWLQGMRRAGVPEDLALAACDQILGLHPEWTESTFPGLLGNVVAGRIANRLDLGGTNCITDAACASSFSALSMGVNELYLGDSDMVIAGGVDTMNDILMYMCFSKTPALSKSEDIRPFSDQADGTMLGEGIGMVALKRLTDAERDGNDIYCVINGVGSSSDGRSKSVYAPVSAGQARALDDAYAKSGYGVDTVELVEAHGTGTVAGDAAEFGGLQMVFRGSGRDDQQWCALGSVKSQIGHTKAAAGAAGLFKVIMALHHQVLPQTAKIDKPNSRLDLESSPFYLNTRSRPWVRDSRHERRGSVSSFGFGGSNFHIALSEYTGTGVRAPRLRTSDVELVVLTGDSGQDVVSQARHQLEATSATGHLRWLAQTTQRAYDAEALARLAVVAFDEEDLGTKLGLAIERIESDPATAFATPTGVHYGTGPLDGDLAFVFPGQGSQYPFMGADLAMSHRQAMAAWDRSADLGWGDTSLHDVVFPFARFEDGAAAADLALLTETQWAQPAIGATSLALLRMLRSMGLQPTHAAGHSFGEVTALHAAGALSETDMLRIARRRGELMAEAAQTPGSMTAVAAPIDEVQALVDRSGIDVVIANHNSPTQVVLSGRTPDIERIEVELAGQHIVFKRLPVATAFHSEVVSGASGAFTEFLADVDVDVPTIAVYSNESAGPYPGDDVAAIRARLGRQLANPVRFVDMIDAMYERGARTFVEVGPSAILTGSIGKILEGRDHRAIPMDNKGKQGLVGFLGGVAQLAAAGAVMDLGALWQEYGEMVNPHDVDEPKLAIAIGGANYGRHYPPSDLSELVGPNPTTTTAAATAATAAAVAADPVAAPIGVPARPAERAVAPAPVAPSASILAAFQAVQQQTADAHAAYLQSMAQVHSTFLEATHQSLEVMGRLAGVAPTSTAMPAAAPVPMVSPMPVPAVAPVPAAAPLPAVAAVPVAPSSPALSVEALTALLLDVVADKTGYPAEMLAMEMELESDLGIDSIKRVEILSGMQDQVPDLPEVDTAVMAELVTLGQIVVYLQSQLQSGGGVPAAASAPALSVEALTALLLDVVADKTGYPAEMLAMEMELESDLGIDSIKRVEILSGMQDQVPDLPEVDTAVMAELVTLGQIVDYLQSQLQGSGAPPAATAAPAAAAAATTVTPAPAASLGRFTLRAVESTTAGIETPGLRGGRIAVIDDGDGIGAALVAALGADGVDAELVTQPPSDGCTGVIFLGGVRQVTDLDQAVAVNREAFATARAVAGSVDLFVTVTDLGGDFGCGGVDEMRAWTAGVTALARTAAIEWPTTEVRAIDVERGGRPPADVAAAIAHELLGGGPEPEVGLRADGTRLTLASTPVPVEPGSMPLDPSDVVVVSGGARGVTAATVVELARASKASFVLLGRTVVEDEPPFCRAAGDDAALKQALLDDARAAGEPVSPTELGRRAATILAVREIRRTIDAIEAAGGQARYLAVDITDVDSVADALAPIRAELGPVTGVVHGAGVLADKLISQKTDEQFDAVFDTKVAGLRALLAATADDPLRLLCLFSSVAARAGNNGQADYAMANEVLNKVAVAEHHRRGSDCVVKSLGWGPWAGGMVSPALEAHFEAMGVAVIPLDEGSRMMVDEIASPQVDQVELVLGGGVVLGSASPVAVERAEA